MRLLADECRHVDIAAALRGAGHEVTMVASSDTGAADEVVLERAASDRAILLTADKDFGKIVIARGAASSGIVLFRRSVADPAGAAARLLALIEERGEALQHLYAVITPAQVRLRRLAGLRP